MQFSTTVEEAAADQLSKTVYRYFNLNELDMVLDSIYHFQRPSKRHGWKRVKKWDRILGRDNTMNREEPPQWVKDEVRRRMNDAIKFL